MTERQENETATDWAAIIQTAVNQFVNRHWWTTKPYSETDNTDQQLALCFAWLKKLVEHEELYGNAAVVASPLAVRAFAYEFWLHLWRERGGRRNEPLQPRGDELQAYWAKQWFRGARTKPTKDGTDVPLRVDEEGYSSKKESPDHAWFREDVTLSGVPYRVQFDCIYRPHIDGKKKRHADALLCLTADVYRNVAGAFEPQHVATWRDDRVRLPEDAPGRQLELAAEMFANSFVASRAPVFTYSYPQLGRKDDARKGELPKNPDVDDAPVFIRAERKGPSGDRVRRATASMLALVLPIGGFVIWHRAELRSELVRAYSLNGYSIFANADCAQSAPLIDVAWDLKSSDVSHPALLRNGQFFMELPPRSSGAIKDRSVVAGQSYLYTLGVRAWLSPVTLPPPAGVTPTQICVEHPISPITITPSEGSRDTVFHFEAYPPSADGEPEAFAWNFFGSDRDRKRDLLFTPWTEFSSNPKIAHRFLVEGARKESDLYATTVALLVRYKGGEVKQYNGYLTFHGEPRWKDWHPAWREPWWRKLLTRALEWVFRSDERSEI